MSRRNENINMELISLLYFVYFILLIRYFKAKMLLMTTKSNFDYLNRGYYSVTLIWNVIAYHYRIILGKYLWLKGFVQKHDCFKIQKIGYFNPFISKNGHLSLFLHNPGPFKVNFIIFMKMQIYKMIKKFDAFFSVFPI